MLLTSVAISRHNAVLECNGFIVYGLPIDNGGRVLVIQQRHMVTSHKVHLYFLVTVLQKQHKTCPYYLLSKQYVPKYTHELTIPSPIHMQSGLT